MIVNMNVNVVRKRLLLSMPIFPNTQVTTTRLFMAQTGNYTGGDGRLDQNMIGLSPSEGVQDKKEMPGHHQ